jgi:hypothetical protein
MKIYLLNWYNEFGGPFHTYCCSDEEDEELTFRRGPRDYVSELDTDDFDVFVVFGIHAEWMGEPIKVLGVYLTFEEACARQENENLSIRDEYALARIALLKWGEPLEGCPQFVR